MSGPRQHAQWQALAAAAAAGAAAGALAMALYNKTQHGSSAAAAAQQQQRPAGEQQQPPPRPLRLEAAVLQSLAASMPDQQQQPQQQPGSPTASSIAGSVAYSLPPTPRFGSSNGRQLSRSSSGMGDGAADPTRLRMLFVVRKDLNWQRQKLAVMVATACLSLFKKLYKQRSPQLMQWEAAKGPKLVLRSEGEAGLLVALERAREAGLACHSIAEATGNPDAPRTRSIAAMLVPADMLADISSGAGLLLL